MKSLKVGYIFVMVTLLSFAATIGIAAMYPSPKSYDYPQATYNYSTDYNSPEYKAQQQKYDDDLKEYRAKNKDALNQKKIWSQNAFILCLVIAILLFILGAFTINLTYFLSVSLFFAAFTIIFFGPAMASYYAENTPVPFIGGYSEIDITKYKQIQFVLSLVGAMIGTGLSFLIRSKDQTTS